MIAQPPVGEGVDPFGLRAPFAGDCAGKAGNTASIHIVIFDIIGPGDPVTQFGDSCLIKQCDLFVQQGFCTGRIVHLDFGLQFFA